MKLKHPFFRFFKRRSLSTRKPFIDPLIDDDAEIIRVYIKKAKPSPVKPDLTPRSTAPHDHRPPSTEKSIALRYPALIPPHIAWTNLAHAVAVISKAASFYRVHFTNLDNQTLTLHVKNGLWGKAGGRMLFARMTEAPRTPGASFSSLQRYPLLKSPSGYPCLLHPATQAPFEIRILTFEPLPAPPSRASTPLPQVEDIDANGRLPDWASRIQRLIKGQTFWIQEDIPRQASLIKTAVKYHEFACQILGLDHTKHSHLREEVESAFKVRLRVLHPDRLERNALKTDDIVKALTWARRYLMPF